MTNGDYTYDENTLKLRINCLGQIYGASLEDYDEAFKRVIDTLLEVKKVNSIVLAKEREYEYDYEQAKLLLEIANIIEELVKQNVIANRDLRRGACRKFYPKWNAMLEYITLEMMRKDPIGAYVELNREIREVKAKMKDVISKDMHDCFYTYRETLNIIKEYMESTALIQKVKGKLASYHIGDRSLYRQIFMPTVRPNFMFTRYLNIPPEDGISVDRYIVNDTQVEVFKRENTTEHFYFVSPPEFNLPEDRYTVLDTARRYMATHKSSAVEFVRSGKIRDIFYSIGKDMIKETSDRLGVRMSTMETEKLATILTRYTAGLGILEILLNDEKVQDIFVNPPVERQPVLIFHSDWEECRTNLIPTMEDAESWATRLRIQSGRPLDEANPVLDTDVTIPGGSARFAIITRTLSPTGLGFAIRRHRDKPWTLPLFIKNKTMSPLCAGLLSFLVDGSVSMIIAGGRGSGKTSILGAMMLELLPKIRVVTIEDTLELPINQMRELGFNIISLKSRSVITRVETEMPASEALRTALRLGDSALIVGEVRSKEAKALYEAMRIGALSNVVAGTIHGESAYGVFDRVVNDLEVPPTSFKATDIVPIAKSLRSADGLHKFRRLTEITEVRKRWNEDPMKEGGFVNLMEYSGKDDILKPTTTLLNGESEILNRIASYVKEWSGDWAAVWGNINLRARIKEETVRIADKMQKPELMEAGWIVKSNSKYHLLSESIRNEIGYSDPDRIYDEWLKWIKLKLK